MLELAKKTARHFLRIVRIRGKQRLFWWKGPPFNVGDWIGPYLYRAITGRDAIYTETSNRSLKTTYVTVGSLARWFCQDSIVWGSGIIERNERMWEPYETLAVRGPYTRERFLELGYECPERYGDPAILMPQFYNPAHTNEFRLGIVPHYSNLNEVKSIFGSKSEILIIDVRRTDVEGFVDQIVKCNRIVSSSLHGLIIGHSYNIPSAWAEFTNKPDGDGIKYMDYFASASDAPAPAPIKIQSTMSIEQIEECVECAPQPCLEPLRRPLMDVCPFI